MSEFSRNIPEQSTISSRLLTWLVEMRTTELNEGCENSTYLLILNHEYTDIPVDTRTSIESGFPANISRAEHGQLWSNVILGRLATTADMFEQEIEALEADVNRIWDEAATIDTDLAAIMSTPDLGDL